MGGWVGGWDKCVDTGRKTHAEERRSPTPYAAHLSLPPLRITLAAGQGVVHSSFWMSTIAMSPFGETVPVMLAQPRVLRDWVGVDKEGVDCALRHVLTYIFVFRLPPHPILCPPHVQRVAAPAPLVNQPAIEDAVHHALHVVHLGVRKRGIRWANKPFASHRMHAPSAAQC